jgi:SIR2-like domain
MMDGLKLIPDIPPVLQDAARRGVLIPFVGAGVSVLAGCPTWNGLANGALRACIDQNKFTHGQLAQIEHLAPRVKLSIARGLELEHGFNIDFKKLIEPTISDANNEIGHRVYRSLGKLGSTFVTTNYDGWLDTELADQPAPVVPPAGPQTTTDNTPSPRRRIHEINEFTPANLNLPKTVFHLHGSLVAPDGMIMTTREYIARYRNDRSDRDAARENRTLTFLNYLFSNKTVLFVGYGLEDLEILEYVIQKARVAPSDGQVEAKHFMLQGYFSHEIELTRSLTQYYRQCDIQLLPFLRDQKNWAQLIHVLEEYARVMPATTPMNLEIQAEMEALLAD